VCGKEVVVRDEPTITLESARGAYGNTHLYTARIPDSFWGTRADDLYRLVMTKLAERIADHYLEQHGNEVFGRITPEAVASLATAEAAAKTAKAYTLPEHRSISVTERRYSPTAERWWNR
jgi:hypothetical protein